MMTLVGSKDFSRTAMGIRLFTSSAPSTSKQFAHTRMSPQGVPSMAHGNAVEGDLVLAGLADEAVLHGSSWRQGDFSARSEAKCGHGFGATVKRFPCTAPDRAGSSAASGPSRRGERRSSAGMGFHLPGMSTWESMKASRASCSSSSSSLSLRARISPMIQTSPSPVRRCGWLMTAERSGHCAQGVRFAAVGRAHQGAVALLELAARGRRGRGHFQIALGGVGGGHDAAEAIRIHVRGHIGLPAGPCRSAAIRAAGCG